MTKYKAIPTDRARQLGHWGEYKLVLVEGTKPINKDEVVLVEHEDHVRKIRFCKAGYRS